MTLKELTQKALKDNGYDGLFNVDCPCACKADDLFPCGEPCDNCEPGYLGPCDGHCESGKCDWHIQRDKPIAGVESPRLAAGGEAVDSRAWLEFLETSNKRKPKWKYRKII